MLAEGPRAASVAAIAAANGAPAGTLYQRFGNRDGVVVAAWLRALERFQSRALGVADDALECAVATATAVVGFARDLPEDARLLLTIRPADLMDAEPDADLQATLTRMNAPLVARLAGLTREFYGRNDARAVDAVARAVVDLPYAVVRRHAGDDPLPEWLEADVAASVRALLNSFG